MAYLSGPTLRLLPTNRQPTRRDFCTLLTRLETDMPGYRFCHDASSKGGVRMLDYPGYRWGRKDLLLLLCILRRCFKRSCLEAMEAVKDFIGPVDCFFAGIGKDSPYKVMRLHGLEWPRVNSSSRRLWANDVSPLFRGGRLPTCLKAFRGAPPWTRAELETFCAAMYDTWNTAPEWWRPGRAFVTNRMAADLKKSRGFFF